MRNVVNAFVSNNVYIFGFALAYFRIGVFIIFLSFHVDCWQFWVEMLNDCPKENIIAVFDVQHDVVKILEFL